ncbi:methylated-DNA--[protein]-cysteine S-methyltransferase [Noviherbaspirillum pedocola]|uniref:Methylated-DNA--protein-cysteine methyltransferase n=1 Tax=Noviherbaspirillum pedocola TaxID=2801341 RepID=A0A934SWZ2_9BURK|nr:methylated-DNA--[protein]-cysteine S-methyltransferase [Noviherbaspirillum pedocola]MBK4737179.1 methylated-DNA--[protein]-cysteine S-methyltransferase [Noviherbaspirillum pedocola]
MIHYRFHASPLGELLLAASEQGLCGLYFPQHRHFDGPALWQRDDAHALLQQTALQLDEYFKGERREFTLPLDLRGTAFQQRVWQRLMQLPYGATSSYALHASAIGSASAARAVGAAIGRNPICIVVPCHRVLSSDGSLAGYAGGLERKRYLLAFEAARQIRKAA